MSRLTHMLQFEAIKLAKLWLDVGGNPDIELAALEPTLWQDGNSTIDCLIAELKKIKAKSNQQVKVSLTTNGSTLKDCAKKLAKSKVDKVRISWHTCNPQLFAEISGGGEYSHFQSGLSEAMNVGLPITFNRVLLKNYLDDLPEQLDFIEKNNLTLKLYDLYWTPELKNDYNNYYVHWSDPIKKYVIPRANPEEDLLENKMVRSRKVYRLNNGGKVVVKESGSLNRSIAPCSSCQFASKCLEGFGDYLRVDPDLRAFPCYLRRDFSTSIRDVFTAKSPESTFKNYLSRIFFLEDFSLLKEIKLRYVLVPYCNFNCFLPGSSISWCLKRVGNYTYPQRKTIF